MKKIFHFLKTITVLPTVIAIFLFTGVSSAYYTLKHFKDFEVFKIGNWKTYPLSNNNEEDPYARAREHLNGTLTLGHKEAIIFEADHDDKGEPFKTSCRYVIKGNIPEAYFFTLYTVNMENIPFTSFHGKPNNLTSFDLLKADKEENFTIYASQNPSPWNWLSLPKKKENFKFILTLYDSNILTSRLKKHAMPSIQKDDSQGDECD